MNPSKKERESQVRIRELKEEFPWTTAQSQSRSNGLHLTGVIHAMEGGLRGEVDDASRMQFEKGWLWEEALSLAFGLKSPVRVGEVELDGIVGSPDGVIGTHLIDVRKQNGDRTFYGVDAVEEYKCTAISSSKSPADMWRWMMQVKGYCKMVGAVKCVFRVLHLEFVPVYKVWELTFTQGELDENWEAIVNQAKVMRKGE
jgi:hypothetical protein